MPSPLGISQREKIEKRLFWTKPILNNLKHRVISRIQTLNRKIATGDTSLWPQGHFRSWKVTGGSFSAITFDRHQLKRWKHFSSVVFRTTTRIDWYAIWPFLNRSLTSGQNFQNDLLRSNYSSFDASRPEKHDTGNMNVMPLLSQKLLRKTFFAETVIF